MRLPGTACHHGTHCPLPHSPINHSVLNPAASHPAGCSTSTLCWAASLGQEAGHASSCRRTSRQVQAPPAELLQPTKQHLLTRTWLPALQAPHAC